MIRAPRDLSARSIYGIPYDEKLDEEFCGKPVTFESPELNALYGNPDPVHERWSPDCPHKLTAYECGHEPWANPYAVLTATPCACGECCCLPAAPVAEREP